MFQWIGFLWSDLSAFPFVQWIACELPCCVMLRVHFCGEGPHLIQPQISCWPALQLDEDRFGIWFEHSAKAVRAQIDACAKWVTAASVFCAWYFDVFGSDLRYDSLILCFHCSTHLQRSWSIEAVHCVKVRGVMVVVPVVLLACNMIFIPAVKKMGHVAPSTYLFCSSCTELLLALQDHSGRYRWRKSLSSCLSGFLAALLDQIFFWIKRPHEDVRSEGEIGGDAGPLVNWKSKGARSLKKSPGSNI